MNFDHGQYAKKKDIFGVIVFESDQDMPPETAYLCYDDLWLLELVFKCYKSDECLDRTNVQGDFSVIGSEFINFISTLATCRIIRKARVAGLLKKMTYGELMDDLSSVWCMTDAYTPLKSDNGYWVHTLNTGVRGARSTGAIYASSHANSQKKGPSQKESRGKTQYQTDYSPKNWETFI